MSETVRTLAQLLAELADNTARLISPERARDLTVSAWGPVMNRAPGMNDDSANTSGAGFFSPGSRWTCDSPKSFFWCFDGTPFAAVWWQVAFFQSFPPPPAVDVPFPARITSNPTPIPALTATGLTGIATIFQNEISGISNVDFDHIQPGQAFTATTTFPSGTVTFVDKATNTIEVSVSATGSGPVTFSVEAIGYDWVECDADPVTGAPRDKPGGRSGTALTAPAMSRSGSHLINIDDAQVMLNVLGTAAGMTIYQFDFAPPPSPSINMTINELSPGVFEFSVPTMPAADVTAGTFGPGVLIPAAQVGSGYPAADLGAGTINAGVSVPAAQVGAGYLYSDLTGPPDLTPYPRWVGPLHFDYTDFTPGGAVITYTIDCYVMPANSRLVGTQIMLGTAGTDVWNDTTGPHPTAIRLGYKDAQNGSANSNYYGANTTAQSSQPVPIVGKNAPPSVNLPDCQNETGAWKVTITVDLAGQTVNNLTSGSVDIWLLVDG